MDKHNQALIKKSKTRQKKIALVFKYTKNKKLSQKYRDSSYKKIQSEIIDFYDPTNEISIKIKAKRNTIRYKRTVIRNAGYSPVEADRMVSWSWKRINNTISGNVIVNKKARRARWKSMSRRKAVDSEFVNLAQKLNKRKHADLLIKKGSIRASAGLYKVNNKGIKVYDKNHSFGWSIAYYYYTEGVDIEKWFEAVKLDPFIPEVYTRPDTLTA